MIQAETQMENNRKKQTIRLILLTVIVAFVTMAVGLLALQLVGGVRVVPAETYEQMADITKKYGKLYVIQKRIDEQWLWDTNDSAEMDAIYEGLVDSLDDKYSEYFTAEEAAEWKSYLDGTYYGIGVSFGENKDGDFQVYKVFTDSPAEKAGVKEGDLIRKVNGKTYKTSEEISKAIKGKTGTKVKVTFERDGKERTLSVMRAEVTENSVDGTVLDGDIGYIRIASFAKKTAEEFKTELASMESKNVKGLIIDIRQNGGGYAEQGITIADMLLPECTITYMEDKQGKKKYYNSDESSTDLPYVLLVDENTASTSEILAAAVQDNKGGKLIGETTFGKGIVQVEYSFEDGSALKLTTHQYFSPNGKKIHKKGVKPDVVVKYDIGSGKDAQLARAKKILKGSAD